jgi:hypothetical protein
LDLSNLPQVRLKSAVSAEFPDTDFVCFQEVWDRFFAGMLISKLKSKYRHFVMDVSRHKLSTQFCMGSKCSTGLFLRISFKYIYIGKAFF